MTTLLLVLAGTYLGGWALWTLYVHFALGFPFGAALSLGRFWLTDFPEHVYNYWT